MSTQAQAEQQTDRLGMTEEQWAQWQAYTRGFGEQDENGVDLSLLRQNLRLTPTERLRKHQKALRMYMEVYDAGVAARGGSDRDEARRRSAQGLRPSAGAGTSA